MTLSERDHFQKPSQGPGPGLSIETRAARESTVVHVSGELDMDGAAALEHEMTRLVSRGVRPVVDLSAVEFIDSMGIRALVKLSRQAADGQPLQVVLPEPDQPRRLLRMTGVDRILAAPPA